MLRPYDVVLLGATPPSRSGLRSEPRASASGFAVAPNLAVTDLERDAEQEFGLILLAIQQAGRVDEVLRAPTGEAHFGRDVDDQRFHVHAGANHVAARCAVA